MEAQEALALVGGHVNEELLVRNEYLAAENEILRSKLQGRIRFSDAERIRLAKIGQRIGLKGLRDIGCIVQPETILRWHRELVSKKFDGTAQRGASTGRRRTGPEIEALIVQFALDNDDWGYDRIVGALANLGHDVSKQTVANVLKRHGIPPSRGQGHDKSWAEFIRSHQEVLLASDFFTVEVLEQFALVTYYVLFFMLVGKRRVCIAGITTNPNERWMKQIARNMTMDGGFAEGMRYLTIDRDTKFCDSFRAIFDQSGIKVLRLPPKSPNLNPFAERWVRSAQDECTRKLLFFGERSLRYALTEFMEHFHDERNHQGKGNMLLFPGPKHTQQSPTGAVVCSQRLGGMLKYYHRQAA